MVMIIYYLQFAAVFPQEWNSRELANGRWIGAINHRVLDGDTLIYRYQGELKRLRLDYIDAPESSQIALDELTEIGRISTQYLRLLCPENSQIELLIHSQDHYGRDIGEVKCSGVIANLEMLKAGWVMPYRYVKFHSKRQRLLYLRSFEKALTSEKGIWAYGGMENPSYWRYEKKQYLKLRKKMLTRSSLHQLRL